MAHILPDPPRIWDYPMASPPPLCPHGVPYAQRCNGCGWVCPTCKRSYAPWVRECNYRHEDGRDAGAMPLIAADTGDIAAMSFRFPAEWSRPHYQHLVRAGGEWREVFPFPGMQVLLGHPVRGGEEAVLRFRLTPQEGGSDSPA